jgi:hypothetical protein
LPVKSIAAESTAKADSGPTEHRFTSDFTAESW